MAQTEQDRCGDVQPHSVLRGPARDEEAGPEQTESVFIEMEFDPDTVRCFSLTLSLSLRLLFKEVEY